MANDNINKMTVILEGNSEKLQKALKAAEKAMTDFDKKGKQINSGSGGLGGILATAKRLAPAISAAFAVREVGLFSKEAYVLAARLEGIERNFKSIEQSGKTSLDELRKATMGAVSDFDLMQKAVQARNFKLPLENLASFFEFATIRSQQTGESVDYLVNSIVLGIGRKSPLILDNLGITLVRLKEAMGKVGRESATVAEISQAVAKIAEEETRFIKALGETSETSGQRIDGLAASWKNFREEFGKSILDEGDSVTSGLSKAISDAGTFLEYANTKGGGTVLGNALSSVNTFINSLIGVDSGLEEMREELSRVNKEAEILNKTAMDRLFMRFGNEIGSTVSEVISFQEGLMKLHLQGELSKEQFKDLSLGVKTYKRILEEQNKVLNEQLMAEQALSDERGAFLDKYKQQLAEIETRFKMGMIEPTEYLNKKMSILRDAVVKMKVDVKELGLAGTEEFSKWSAEAQKLSDILSQAYAGSYSDLADKATQHSIEMYKELGEAIKSLSSPSNGLDFLEPETISKLDSASEDYLRSLNDIRKLQDAAVVSEQEANRSRLKSINEYMEALALAGQEIPEWLMASREAMAGTIFDKSELTDLAQMWAALSTAMGQVAGVFNEDSGISGLISKFAKLAQVISAVVAAQVAWQAAKGDIGAAPRAIAAAAAVITGLSGLIGSVTGGSSGGSGTNYNNSNLGGSAKLYTEISGQNLRIILDREGRFSNRRG